jgi:hypothetical protein
MDESSANSCCVHRSLRNRRTDSYSLAQSDETMTHGQRRLQHSATRATHQTASPGTFTTKSGVERVALGIRVDRLVQSDAGHGNINLDTRIDNGDLMESDIACCLVLCMERSACRGPRRRGQSYSPRKDLRRVTRCPERSASMVSSERRLLGA